MPIGVDNLPESIPPPHVGHVVVVPLQLEAAGVRQSVIQPPQSERIRLACMQDGLADHKLEGFQNS
jgi:hypothetical protein